MKHYVVISADCHAGPELARVQRLPRPEVPRRLRGRAGRAPGAHRRAPRGRGHVAVHGRRRVQGGVVRRGRGGQQPPRDRHARRRGTPPSATRSSTTTASPARSCSPVPTPPPAPWARHSAPGSTPSPTMDPEHLLAGARAYNRWAAEICSESPERRAGLIVAPILGDLDGAIAEIQRAHAEGLARRHHHPAAVGRPRVVHELPLRPGVGGVRRSSTCPCTATRVPARTRTTAKCRAG